MRSNGGVGEIGLACALKQVEHVIVKEIIQSMWGFTVRNQNKDLSSLFLSSRLLSVVVDFMTICQQHVFVKHL